MFLHLLRERNKSQTEEIMERDIHKGVTFGINNWELYRSAVESAKEIPMTGNAYYLDKALAMMEKREYEEASKIYDRVLN